MLSVPIRSDKGAERMAFSPAFSENWNNIDLGGAPNQTTLM